MDDVKLDSKRIFDPGKTLRYYQRYAFVQKIKIFYQRRGVKKGKYLSREEFEGIVESFINIVREKYSNIVLSKTQLSYMANEPNLKRLEYTLHQIQRAVFWEIAASSDIVDYMNSLAFNNAVIISIKSSIASGLGIGNNEKCFDRSDQVEYYRKEISSTLGTSEYEIGYLLDDIKKLCEYDCVLVAIQNCNYIGELPKRDRKKIYEDKQKFERIKAKTIEGLKFLNLPHANVENVKYTNKETYGWVNYEMTLKHIKKVLYDELILVCGTGKRRARDIVKILEYL